MVDLLWRENKLSLVLKKIVLSLFFLWGIVLFSSNVLADGNEFSIDPILPQNQNPEVQSYFDLSVRPSSTQALQVSVKNNSSKAQKYNVSINTANTNQNGIIDYSMDSFKKDSSLKISLKDCLTTMTPQIEIPAGKEKVVEFELKVPQLSFKGIVLGGITIEPLTETNAKGITNVFTRTLAVQLSESNEKVTPNLVAGDVEIAQENQRNNVKLNLRNISPVIISKVTSQISILRKGESKPVLEQTREQLSFAPNSNFKLMTEWESQFEPGDYRYIIKLKDTQGHEWTFKKNFIIASKKADKLNKTSVDKKVSHWMDYILYLLGALLIVSALIIAFVFKKKDKTNIKNKI